jgi:3-oxoacyl-[acyl-carrier protein] reductase
MLMEFGLAGRVVCVTGGGSGIGLSAVEHLARDGAKIAVVDIDPSRVDTAVAVAQKYGATASGFPLDIRDSVALNNAGDAIQETLGPVKGLIAAAGVSGASPAEHVEEEDWHRILSVNATGMFLTCQEFGRRMIHSGGGSIVTVGSIYGLGGQPGRLPYVASKFAVIGLTKTFAIEWGRFGVRVNCIAPGLVDTPLMRQGVPASFVANVVEDRTPLGRMACTDDVALAALALLSDASAYITGTTIPVDGGATAGVFVAKQGADMSSKRLQEAYDDNH